MKRVLRRLLQVHRPTRNGKGLSNTSMIQVCSAATQNAPFGNCTDAGILQRAESCINFDACSFQVRGGGPGGYDGVNPGPSDGLRITNSAIRNMLLFGLNQT